MKRMRLPRNVYLLLMTTISFMVTSVLYQNCARVPFLEQGSTVLSSSSVAGLDSTYQNSALEILKTKCSACHDNGASEGGVGQITNVNSLLEVGLIVSGSAETSPLYQMVVSNQMPPGGPLSDSEKDTLAKWIQGATEPLPIVPPIPPANQLPVVNAGADLAATLPLASGLVISATGSDPDGSLAGMQWSQLSGPSATLMDAQTLSLKVTNLVAGTYQFLITVIDNSGATASDQVQVIVFPAPNQLPTANAGADQSITLPTNAATFNGGGADSDGSITTYSWRQASGPSTASLTGNTTAVLKAVSLQAGTYVFELTVTDNSGGTGKDTVSVFVNSAVNTPPIANAGADQTLNLPTSSVNLVGSASDSNGSVTSTLWTQVSGPAQASIATPTSLTTQVTFSVAGSYVFQLKATDNLGAVATDNLTVTVVAAANQMPTANAGADLVINMPMNSVTITGWGTDSDGTVTQYFWSQISGPNTAVLSGASSNILTASSLIQGTYIFRLTVRDDRSGTGTDHVQVVVGGDISGTYSWIHANIFQPKCISCHGASLPKAGISFSTYTSAMEVVRAGNALGSDLYNEVISNSMPEGGPPLSTAEKDAIRRWIDGGAPNN